MAYDIFISYKRADKDKVFALKDEIERQTGLSCWIDLDGIECDAQFVNVIMSAINISQVFLFMYSHNHSAIEDYGNDWTVREINFAQKKKKRIVFLNIDGTPLSDWFEFMFGTKQQVDATSPEMINRLYKDLKIWTGGTQSAKPVLPETVISTQSKSINKVKKQFEVKGVAFNMIGVEGGSFKMGSEDEEASSDEQPIHEVRVSDFWIGETQVTQGLWKAVLGNNPSHFKNGDNYPVENVSWNDCRDFVRKLNELTEGKRPAGTKFRLPTEAEWEYAARGGKHKEGYEYSGSDKIDQVAWYGEDWETGSTHPVHKKQPNALGIYDMSGNVWEWCEDWYGENYYSNSPTQDPVNTTKASDRVLRGGGWYGGAGYCRVSFRGGSHPDDRYGSGGVRLALSSLH